MKFLLNFTEFGQIIDASLFVIAFEILTLDSANGDAHPTEHHCGALAIALGVHHLVKRILERDALNKWRIF